MIASLSTKGNTSEGLHEMVETSLRDYTPTEPCDIIFKDGFHFKENNLRAPEVLKKGHQR